MRYILPLLFATPAFAEIQPESLDILTIRQGEPFIEVYYSNSASQSSMNISGQPLELNGVRVMVFIQLGKGDNGAERIIVKPDDDGLIAVPAVADVLDGDDIVITIMPPMF